MANILDFVIAVIAITIQYPHINVIMCWYTLRVFVHACMHACEHSRVKYHANNWVKSTSSGSILKKKSSALIHIHEYMLQTNHILGQSSHHLVTVKSIHLPTFVKYI